MIPAKEFEGELWIKASDCISAISKAVETEREACAKVADNGHWNQDRKSTRLNSSH